MRYRTPLPSVIDTGSTAASRAARKERLDEDVKANNLIESPYLKDKEPGEVQDTTLPELAKSGSTRESLMINTRGADLPVFGNQVSKVSNLGRHSISSSTKGKEVDKVAFTSPEPENMSKRDSTPPTPVSRNQTREIIDHQNFTSSLPAARVPPALHIYAAKGANSSRENPASPFVDTPTCKKEFRGVFGTSTSSPLIIGGDAAIEISTFPKPNEEIFAEPERVLTPGAQTKVKRSRILESRNLTMLTIDSTLNVPGLFRRVEKQLTRNLILNARGITENHLEEPRLNHQVVYNRYPPYKLGYEPRRVPAIIRVVQPAKPRGEEHEWFTDHAYKDYLSLSNLPENLFLLERGEDPLANVRVPDLADETGRIVKTDRGSTLRYFSFLPRYIKHRVGAYILEFWFRLDSRLEPSDIIDRMQPKHGQNQSSNQPVNHNAISMRRQRFRDMINARAAQPGRVDPCKNEVEGLATITEAQVLLNTTMWVAHDTLWIPRVNEGPVEIRDYVNTKLPLTYFLDQGPRFVPSPRMEMTILLRHRMQTQAISQGFGIDHKNWTNLNIESQPSRWHDRGVRNAAQSKRRHEDSVQFTRQKSKALDIDGKDVDEWLQMIRKQLVDDSPSPPRPQRRPRTQTNRAIEAGTYDRSVMAFGIVTPTRTRPSNPAGSTLGTSRSGVPRYGATNYSSPTLPPILRGTPQPRLSVSTVSSSGFLSSSSRVGLLNAGQSNINPINLVSDTEEESDYSSHASDENNYILSSGNSAADFMLGEERSMDFPDNFLSRIKLAEIGPDVLPRLTGVSRELAMKRYDVVPPPRYVALKRFPFPQLPQGRADGVIGVVREPVVVNGGNIGWRVVGETRGTLVQNGSGQRAEAARAAAGAVAGLSHRRYPAINARPEAAAGASLLLMAARAAAREESDSTESSDNQADETREQDASELGSDFGAVVDPGAQVVSVIDEVDSDN